MSIVNIFAIDCTDVDCPDGVLGAMDNQSENCNDVVQSEVNSLIFWHPTLGTAPTNWGPGIAAIDFSIDNTDATDADQKQIFVTGAMAEPEDVTKTVNGFQEVVISRTFTLTATLFTFGDVTFDYLRKLQCGKVKPQFDFTTAGDKLIGKDGGITPSKFTLNYVLDEGEESCEKWTFEIQWKSLTAPDRLDNPL
jgi:hypothetical protein